MTRRVGVIRKLRQGWCDERRQETAAVEKGAYVMKGLGIERASAGSKRRFAKLPDGACSPSRPDDGLKCQEQVDTKAFTGRGSRHELRQTKDAIATLEQEMRKLSDINKQVPGAAIYLMLHRRSDTGYTFLRWCEYGGDKRHLSWERGQAIFDQYAEPMCSWYAQLARQAIEINALHLECRKRLSSQQSTAQAKRMPLFARPLP